MILRPSSDIVGSYLASFDGASAATEFSDLISRLPHRIQAAVAALGVVGHEEILEIFMDLGRPAVIRLRDRDVLVGDASDPLGAPTPTEALSRGKPHTITITNPNPNPNPELSHPYAHLPLVTRSELEKAVTQMGIFGGDNRAGIDRTLHRISRIVNRKSDLVGLTCRVGKAVPGAGTLAADLVLGGKSVLFLGPPCSGKTTALREMARILADVAHKRVVIVDTSNEIAGDGTKQQKCRDES